MDSYATMKNAVFRLGFLPVSAERITVSFPHESNCNISTCLFYWHINLFGIQWLSTKRSCIAILEIMKGLRFVMMEKII